MSFIDTHFSHLTEQTAAVRYIIIFPYFHI